MSEEWKELKIDNLPPDILVGDYEFEKYTTDGYQESWDSEPGMRTDILVCLEDGTDYRYRKRQPVEIKVGMFGTYSNIEICLGINYGKLEKYEPESEYPFEIGYGGPGFLRVKYFTPGLPTGFNQDGTPKEEG